MKKSVNTTAKATSKKATSKKTSAKKATVAMVTEAPAPAVETPAEASAPAKEATQAQEQKRVNKNTFEINGRICENGLSVSKEKGFARFTIAHNMGKNNPTLFVEVVMFAKNFSKDVDIPWDSLKKGQPILVSGFMKANNYEKDGKTIRRNQYIGLTATVLTEEDLRAESKNSFALTGHICERGLEINREKGFVKMTIGHNQGKNADPLFVDLYIRNKNGKKDVEIPWDNLVKGAFVTLGGYQKGNVWEKEGKKHFGTDKVAVSIMAEAPAQKAQKVA